MKKHYCKCFYRKGNNNNQIGKPSAKLINSVAHPVIESPRYNLPEDIAHPELVKEALQSKDSKMAIYHFLRRELGQNAGLELYRSIKPIFQVVGWNESVK